MPKMEVLLVNNYMRVTDWTPLVVRTREVRTKKVRKAVRNGRGRPRKSHTTAACKAQTTKIVEMEVSEKVWTWSSPVIAIYIEMLNQGCDVYIAERVSDDDCKEYAVMRRFDEFKNELMSERIDRLHVGVG